jgi:hypothetical protein
MSSESTARALALEMGMVPGATGAEDSLGGAVCDQLPGEVIAGPAAAGIAIAAYWLVRPHAQ